MPDSVVCAHCGSVDHTKSYTPGSILIELVAWFCFLIPGVLYSLWRLNGRKRVCAACGSPNLVPATSPLGRRLMREQQADAEEPGA